MWVTSTALTSGSPSRALLTAAGSTAAPGSKLSILTSAPYRDAISPNLSPKYPMLVQSTRSPGDSVLTMAASIAPVPEEVRMKRSPSVLKTRLSLSVTR